VSRAPVDQPGYDWTEQILEDFKQFISGLELDEVKIEFQGGEPTLRPDLLEEISSFVRDEASHAEFVVCSNMVDVDETRIKSYLRSPDVSISTSIDGSVETMSKNRTSNDEMSEKVFANFRSYLDQFGPSKISALPTITEVQLSDPAQVITKYLELGFQSIFLRPVNYMGFARKQHKESIDNYLRWFDFYEEAMSLILEANEEGYLEEYYTALVVRKIFAGDSVGFVDYRSPSRFGHNFLVIDYDGVVYPSDEARMLSRLNYVDLSIGSLRDGLDEAKLAEINLQAENQTNPDCIHCAYQPFCGIDIVDDLSRYSKLDVIKHDSWFCKRQMSIFDFVFDKIERRDMRWLRVFSKWVKGNNQPMGSMELFRD
jgi:radical SAM protein with 4Fe4S-binding SPASM domain